MVKRFSYSPVCCAATTHSPEGDSMIQPTPHHLATLPKQCCRIDVERFLVPCHGDQGGNGVCTAP